jgi:predicted nucleotidyltransferase
MNTKKTTGLTEIELQALGHIKERVLKRYSVRQFILFGSKARGDFRLDSDIDLLMVTAHPLTWRENDDIIGEVYEANLAFNTLFTVHLVAEEEWNRGCLPFKENIEAEGVAV